MNGLDRWKGDGVTVVTGHAELAVVDMGDIRSGFSVDTTVVSIALGFPSLYGDVVVAVTDVLMVMMLCRGHWHCVGFWHACLRSTYHSMGY